MKNFPFNPFFSPESSQFEEDISPESFVEFLTDLLRHQRNPSDAGPDHESFLDPPRWAAPLREPECAFCHSKMDNLKRCSSCRRVFYCSKTCQKHHWKKHKPECQSNWNQKLILDFTRSCLRKSSRDIVCLVFKFLESKLCSELVKISSSVGILMWLMPLNVNTAIYFMPRVCSR